MLKFSFYFSFLFYYRNSEYFAWFFFVYDVCRAYNYIIRQIYFEIFFFIHFSQQHVLYFRRISKFDLRGDNYFFFEFSPNIQMKWEKDSSSNVWNYQYALLAISINCSLCIAFEVQSVVKKGGFSTKTLSLLFIKNEMLHIFQVPIPSLIIT